MSNALNHKAAPAALICLLAALCLALATGVRADGGAKAPAAPAASAPAAPKKWQHLALTQDLRAKNNQQEVARTIVKLGQDGWEMVSVANVTQAGTTTKTVYYFKRPLLP